MLSVNTNGSALSALRALSRINSELATTQNRISTGLKVSSARDDGATYAMAQNMRGQVAGLHAARQSIERALSTTDVALAGVEAMSDIFVEMKGIMVAASDKSLDQASIDSLGYQFFALADQAYSIYTNASFNNTNLIDGSGTDASAIVSHDASQRVTVPGEDLRLDGALLDFTIGGAPPYGNITWASQPDATNIAAMENNIKAVNNAAARLGAGRKGLEVQLDFNGKLTDTFEVGIGNLVDADLARESAKLQALQVKQQLAVQALAIANRGPAIILQLFQ